MSDTETETEAQVEQTTDLAAEVEKWKALARKNEARAKENSDKAKRLDDLEEAQKSELEKLTARAEAAEAKIAEREKADAARALAEEIAKEKSEGRSVPLAASILRGSTREELEAHADSILALLPEKPKAATDGTGGARGDDIDEEEADAKEIAANIRI